MQRPVRETTDSAQDHSVPITEEIKHDPDEPTNQQFSEVKQEIKIEPVVDSSSTAASNHASIFNKTIVASVEKSPEPHVYTPEYDGSDDDYTNDYTEVSSKRRRRETRSCRNAAGLLLLVALSQSKPSVLLRGQYSITDNLCTWEGTVVVPSVCDDSGVWR